jgi:SLOG cluster2
MENTEPVNISGIPVPLEVLLDQEKQHNRTAPPIASVGISISDSDDMEALGYTRQHLEDALTETARYLLANRYRLVYGGDLRTGGFTYQLSDLVKMYSPGSADFFWVTNYLAWPLYHALTLQQQATLNSMGIEMLKGEAPPGSDAACFASLGTVDDKLDCAMGLRLMRRAMVRNTNVRIIMGGQLTGYKGCMPGVVEEALLAIEAKQPLYLCGAWGGAAAAIIDAVLKGESEWLTKEYQSRQEGYAALLDAWNVQYADDRIDYAVIVQKFYEKGVSGLSAVNGLSDWENQRLFCTPHPQEMIFLILRGLKRVFGY